MSSKALVLALSAFAAAFAPPGGRGPPATEDITFSKIQKVLEVFDDQVTFLKKQYVKTIEKRDDFFDVGFLLTDYASDFYDGKQITLCVYI